MKQLSAYSIGQHLTRLLRQGSPTPLALAELNFEFGKVCFSNTWLKPKQACLIVMFLPDWVGRETGLPEADHKTVRTTSAMARNYPKEVSLELGDNLLKQ